MDFTKYGLDDEVLAQIKTDYEADIQGLKAKNTDLIGREIKLKAEIESKALEFATKEQDAKVLLAEKEGDIEKYKLAVQEREDNLAIVKQEFRQAEEGRLIEAELSNFSTKLVQDPAARSYMQSKFKENIEFVDGQLKAKDPTKTIEQLAESLISDKANANYILQSVGSGAGSVGSVGNGTATTGRSKMNADQKASYIGEHGQDAYLKLPK